MIYAIGDIHGYADELKSAHARIEADRAAHGVDGPVVHLGDLTDRGPDSRGVIQFLLDGIKRGEDWIVIKGNHDRLFAQYVLNGTGTDNCLRAGLTWLSPGMGGDKTLASYGVTRKMLEKAEAFHARAASVVPAEHVEFVNTLPLWHRTDDLIFVHAGIRPGIPLEEQTEDDLLWIRDDFLWHLHDHEALVVHGHTPVDTAEHYGNRVNLDSGAGYGNPLTAAVFEGTECYVLTDKGRERLDIPGVDHQ